MSFIIGSVKKIIYENNTNSYKVGLLKVKETDDESIKEYTNHTIYFVGNFNNLNTEINYKMQGNLINHPKYGAQYSVNNYEMVNPNTNEELISYLGSGLFEGIGLKIAKKIVDKYGINSFEVIKNTYESITTIKGITLKKAKQISEKLNNLTKEDELIRDLTTMGFSVSESVKIVKEHKIDLEYIIKNDLYILTDILDFDKVDSIYLKYNDFNSDLRIENIIIYSIKTICYKTGNTLANRESVYLNILKYFNNNFKVSSFNLYVENLIENSTIYEFNDYLMLNHFYNTEKKIGESINIFNKIKTNIKESSINSYIKDFENINNITFNKEQKNAIRGGLINNLFIISGGPGTGKTTIIKAIVDFYEDKNSIALLAPTGRSAKRMSESVLLPASTIHKFLKWDKETGKFGLNINNKSKYNVIIIDEFSMVDMFLFSSLIDALKTTAKIVIVGDANQLPSISPGNLLFDLLNSKLIKKQYLNTVYRTNNNSYINILANNVKECITYDSFDKYCDFKFIESTDNNIIDHIKNICESIKHRNITLDEFQVLVPMYKGINGIDNINHVMQDIFNPADETKKEISQIGFIFRLGDKVMNTINDVDNNVYNGDVGYIKNIILGSKKMLEIDFSGNIVMYEQENFDKLTLAYAISIHKSQGSEYDNVLLLIADAHKRMHYNKLIYTGITRAKKSLIIIGKKENFNAAIKYKDITKRITHLSANL